MKTEAPTRERKRQRSRAHILSAARELVLEQGADVVSLREVAARAGFSPASLYEYFGSKEEIITALAGEVAVRLATRLGAVPATLPPTKRLIRLTEAYIAFARENPQDYLLMFSHLRSGRRAPSDVLPPASPYGLVRAAAQAGIEEGRFAPRLSADDIAYGLWAYAHGSAMLQITHLSGFQADFEAADRVNLEALVAGFTLTPSS